MYKNLVPLLFLLSLPAHAIFGGSAAGSRSAVARHSVAVIGEFKQSKGLYICSGALVAPNLVLTAAHCTVGKNLRIVFANNALSALREKQKKIIKPVASVALHPKSGTQGSGVADLNFGSYGVDLALLDFAGAAPEPYESVDVVFDEEEVDQGHSVVAAGYGQRDADSGAKDGILNFVTLKIRVIESGNNRALLEQKGGKGVCHGDSGAPVFTVKKKTLRLWAVVSGGSSDGCEDYGMVTKLADNDDTWLKKMIEKKTK